MGRASFQGLSLFCGSSQERLCSAVSRKQILGLLILCGAVILHTTLWPYNFRFDWGSVPARLLSATRLPFSDGGGIRSRFSTTPSCALEHMPSGPH